MIPLGAVQAGKFQSFYFNEVALDNPVNWWKLNEGSGTDIADSGTAGDNGTVYSGTGAFTALDLGGGSGGSYQFNGDGQISFGDIGTDAESSLSIECIVKLGDTSSNQCFYKEGGASNGLALGIFDSNFRIAFNSGVLRYAEASTSGYSVGDIVHVLGLLDDSSEIRLYLNGSLASTNTVSVGAHNGACYAGIGNTYCGSSAIYQSPLNASASQHPFTGHISDVAIYFAALSDARIAAHAGAVAR